MHPFDLRVLLACFCLAFAVPSYARAPLVEPCTTALSFLGKSEIPLLTLTGCSHASFGKAVGSTFRTQIQQRLETPAMGVLRDFIDSRSGREMLESFASFNAHSFPEYFKELEGIAAGSLISMQEVLLLNLRQELSTAAGLGDIVPDCSDQLLHSALGGPTLLGHNEDNSGDLLNASYFIQTEMDGSLWTAFTYAGELSSTAFGFNDAGIAFTLNALFPTNVSVPGIGRNFVSRDLLQASSYEDGLQRVTRAKYSAGHNYNLIFMPTKSGPLRMATVEVGPGGAHDVLEIPEVSSYFHANTFQRLAIAQLHEESSIHRLRRAAEIPVPQDGKAILELLGDTEDAEYPIFRTGQGGTYTLVTVLVDLQAATMNVYTGNPKDQHVQATFDLRWPSEFRPHEGTV